jgi:hypothetical protein
LFAGVRREYSAASSWEARGVLVVIELAGRSENDIVDVFSSD